MKCSFCDKPLSEVKYLTIKSDDCPETAICDECVDICLDIRAAKTSPAQAWTERPEPTEAEPNAEPSPE